ncbi:hypothetical protein C6401_09110 [Arthrobacter woluwensis]|uniref:DUF4190 domain-containing protein n=1 Tax=Arthrobacter woluwensis TaxID=156980 RepID=UPI000D11EC24|nr:DUF4190 domain-containing protein [Arthrobacter woluwensis]PSS43905.1 hypothetical protein C6401_09110 [Arthrobacter woluwensis]
MGYRSGGGSARGELRGPLPPGREEPLSTKTPSPTLALSSLLCCLLPPPTGLVLGVVALHRIDGPKGEGRALAVAGIVLSSVWAVLLIVLTAVHAFTTQDQVSPPLIGRG